MKVLSGDDLGVARNENFRVVETENPRVVFSYARKGKAIVFHLSCEKEGLKHLKDKCEEFIDWLFKAYPWCRMVIVTITDKPSLERLAIKCGFEKLYEENGAMIYVRTR